MKNKVTVIGSLNYDIILKVSRLPHIGETFPANSVTFASGGKGANQAVQTAKLGVDTYMLGCVGNDIQGDFLVGEVKKYGVNTDYIKRVNDTSGLGVVEAVEDGSVYCCIVRGANFDIEKEDIDQIKSLLQESEILILQMEIPQEINEYAIKLAKKCNCKVILNAAPAADISADALQQVDILVVNEVEAAYYLNYGVDNEEVAKKGALQLANQYNFDVIITLGKLGAVICENKETTFIPSKEVEAVETTGAGDSFIGGIAYALMQGKTLVEAGEIATNCSAITVCRMGAQPSMPTLDEIL